MTATTITIREMPDSTLSTISGFRAMHVEVNGVPHEFLLNTRGEWWEFCTECVGGFFPVEHGVCVACGGIDVLRVASTELGMRREVRRRERAYHGTLNPVERAEVEERARVRAWNVRHANLASDLARERAHGTLGRNVLGDLALAAVRAPLSVKQEALAVRVLIERAWVAAHAETKGK